MRLPFRNTCQAGGATNCSRGECETSGGGNGNCVCTKIYQPVCCNGQSYGYDAVCSATQAASSLHAFILHQMSACLWSVEAVHAAPYVGCACCA